MRRISQAEQEFADNQGAVSSFHGGNFGRERLDTASDEPRPSLEALARSEVVVQRTRYANQTESALALLDGAEDGVGDMPDSEERPYPYVLVEDGASSPNGDDVVRAGEPASTDDVVMLEDASGDEPPPGEGSFRYVVGDGVVGPREEVVMHIPDGQTLVETVRQPSGVPQMPDEFLGQERVWHEGGTLPAEDSSATMVDPNGDRELIVGDFDDRDETITGDDEEGPLSRAEGPPIPEEDRLG